MHACQNLIFQTALMPLRQGRLQCLFLWCAVILLTAICLYMGAILLCHHTNKNWAYKHASNASDASNATTALNENRKVFLTPELRQLIQTYYVPPFHTGHGIQNSVNIGMDSSQFMQASIINKEFFRNKKNGFFFECGANDGEYLSNTLMYEKYFNWTGILVEADPTAFKKLVTKQRRAHSFNLCLSDTIARQPFLLIPGGLAKLDVPGDEDTEKWRRLGAAQVNVPCVPINAILEFVGVKHINYFVLDVEGHEPEILANFDFQAFTFDVLQLELCGICIKQSPGLELKSNSAEGDVTRNYFLKKLLDMKGYEAAFTIGQLDIVYKRKTA